MTAKRKPALRHILSLAQQVRDRARRERLIGVTSEELRGAEIILGFKLPAQLRQWYLMCDGGWLEPPGGLIGLLGNYEEAGIVGIIRGGWPRSKLPIASDGSGGGYCLLTDYPDHSIAPIGFVSGTNRDTVDFVVSSCLELFLYSFVKANLDKDRKWPMHGMKWYLDRDPDLSKIEDVALAWTKEE